MPGNIPQEIKQIINLSEKAAIVQDIDGFAEVLLQNLEGYSPTFLYICDSRFSSPRFYQRGFQPDVSSEVEKLANVQCEQLAQNTDSGPLSFPLKASGRSLLIYPLWENNKLIGLVGFLIEQSPHRLSSLWDSLHSLTVNTIGRLADWSRTQRQLAHLNSYLTVSSMLTQPLGLHDLLDTILSYSMEAVSAEAASVLLLDDEKKNFHFYQVEGPAKPVLMTSSFSADTGIAGWVLQHQESQVINEVGSDPRFYKEIDTKSGFKTRNMIALPLTAEEERIGVLEVINKVGVSDFTEEERILLASIADEVAFAIRNAKLFEYLASLYCKQRQGQSSCAGCKRPLGSWTPCVKYRQAEV
ncbi:GAF domain-containing protein [Chloroflexota bacterium]